MLVHCTLGDPWIDAAAEILCTIVALCKCTVLEKIPYNGIQALLCNLKLLDNKWLHHQQQACTECRPVMICESDFQLLAVQPRIEGHMAPVNCLTEHMAAVA
jgi:hypothetical protein